MDDGVEPRLLLVAHCLLNPYSAVKGHRTPREAARYAVMAAVRAGVGVVQLPCPEFTQEGPERWGKVHEQLDTVVYRRHCQALVDGVMEELREYLVDGAEVLGVIGVEGSPTCGAYRVASSADWGGDFVPAVDGTPRSLPVCESVTGRGILLETLTDALEEEGLDVPVIGVPDDDAGAGALERFRAVVEMMLSGAGISAEDDLDAGDAEDWEGGGLEDA